MVFPAQFRAEGLNSLIEVGKSMADIKEAMEEDTRAFNIVNAAVRRGAIKKGLPKESIRSSYGEPVIANDDFATGREKWVYMPASSTFFKGEKIYLFFDSKGNLDEVKVYGDV